MNFKFQQFIYAKNKRIHLFLREVLFFLPKARILLFYIEKSRTERRLEPTTLGLGQTIYAKKFLMYKGLLYTKQNSRSEMRTLLPCENNN